MTFTPQRAHYPDNEDPVTFGQWVGTLFLIMLPGIGLILLIYWALSAHTNTSKRNYARAFLLFQIPLLVGLFAFSAAVAIPAFQKVREASLARTAQAPSASQARTPSTSPASTTAGPPREFNEPMRIFKAVDGRALEATVVGFVGEQVRVRRSDGLVFTIDITRFSEEDIAYLNRLRNKPGAQ